MDKGMSALHELLCSFKKNEPSFIHKHAEEKQSTLSLLKLMILLWTYQAKHLFLKILSLPSSASQSIVDSSGLRALSCS